MTSSQKDIDVSYSVSNEFFELWLDKNMHYTSAAFLNGDETLEEAQEKKVSILADYAEVTPDSLVLDIGCGWGACLEYMSRARGVKSPTASRHRRVSSNAVVGTTSWRQFVLQDALYAPGGSTTPSCPSR